MLLTTYITNTYFRMCKELIYNPSPILFNVDYTYHKFVKIILSICEVLIGHGQLCP